MMTWMLHPFAMLSPVPFWWLYYSFPTFCLCMTDPGAGAYVGCTDRWDFDDDGDVDLRDWAEYERMLAGAT